MPAPSSNLIRACSLAGLLCLAAGTPLSAQVISGFVRSTTSGLGLPSALVIARDEKEQVLATAEADSTGYFRFRVPARGKAFELRVRRLGYAVMTAKVKALEPRDTVDFEFLMDEVAMEGDAVIITAEQSLNDKRLADAYRSGWKVYDPELIAGMRERHADFFQMLRSLGNPSLYIPRTNYECVRNSRNSQCLTYVVDGQVWGPTANILPSDVYFMAVVNASEARARFGDRAPWGAIVVYTRSRLDRVQPRRRP